MALLRHGGEEVVAEVTRYLGIGSSAGSVCDGMIGVGFLCANKVVSGAGSRGANELVSDAGSRCDVKVFPGAGYYYGGGMVLSKGRGWAAGITSRAFSTKPGSIDYGKLPDCLKLGSLTQNQLYLIQSIDEVRREARHQFLEVRREQQLLADELDAIMALERDVISESRREMLTVFTLGALAGGLIVFGSGSDASPFTTGGSGSSAPGADASPFTAGGSGTSTPGAVASPVTGGGLGSSAPGAGASPFTASGSGPSAPGAGATVCTPDGSSSII
ncbi:unnamed protein product [Urochloa humidicola]